MAILIQDLRLGFRALRKSAGFTAIALLTLSLGIAGTIIVFSVINAVLLHPLPYPHAERLTVLRWQDEGDLSARAFLVLRNYARSFSSVAALYPVDVGVNISGSVQPQYVKALSVSKEFFPTLGASPVIGRAFTAQDELPNAVRVVILSHGTWTQNFAGEPAAVGREMQINGTSYRIAGIMPRSFRSYPDADVWLPLQLSPGMVDAGSDYRVIARLGAGVSRPQAQQEVDELASQYSLAGLLGASDRRIAVRDLQGFLVYKVHEGLALLAGAVSLVFLIACTNVSVLVLVRAAATTQTIAIRAALGLSRARLVRSLMTESVVLALGGGLLGLILAKESLPALRSILPANLPLALNITIDRYVLLFVAVISMISPLFFGLAPALKLSRANIAQLVIRTSRNAGLSGDQMRTVRLLVSGQTTLTVTLLAATMILVKSLLTLYSVPLGFDSDNLVVAQVSLVGQRYAATAPTSYLESRIVERLQSVQGVLSAAAVHGLPLERGLNLPVQPVAMPELGDHADEYRPVTSTYFTTLRIKLLSGRSFLDSDTRTSEPVAIVNETMARHWWPGTSPIGHSIVVGNELGPQFSDAPRRIIGVAADIREKGPDQPPSPTMFVPENQVPDNITAFIDKVFLLSIVVRTSGRVELAPQFRAGLQAIDPGLPVAFLRPFSQVIDNSLAGLRFVTLLTALFGVFCLVLTIIGTYGFLSYEMRLRRREIAVRVAVGASRSQIIRMVALQSTRRISIAIVFGLVFSVLAQNLIHKVFYNARDNSLLLIGCTGALLSAVAISASLVTAIRAVYVDPAAVLRNE